MEDKDERCGVRETLRKVKEGEHLDRERGAKRQREGGKRDRGPCTLLNLSRCAGMHLVPMWKSFGLPKTALCTQTVWDGRNKSEPSSFGCFLCSQSMNLSSQWITCYGTNIKNELENLQYLIKHFCNWILTFRSILCVGIVWHFRLYCCL